MSKYNAGGKGLNRSESSQHSLDSKGQTLTVLEGPCTLAKRVLFLHKSYLYQKLVIGNPPHFPEKGPEKSSNRCTRIIRKLCSQSQTRS